MDPECHCSLKPTVVCFINIYVISWLTVRSCIKSSFPKLKSPCNFSSKYSKCLYLNIIYLFIYFWLHWVFVVVCGLFVVGSSLVAMCGLLSSCDTRV